MSGRGKTFEGQPRSSVSVQAMPGPGKESKTDSAVSKGACSAGQGLVGAKITCSTRRLPQVAMSHV